MSLNLEGEYLLEDLFSRSVNQNGVLADIAGTPAGGAQPQPPNGQPQPQQQQPPNGQQPPGQLPPNGQQQPPTQPNGQQPPIDQPPQNGQQPPQNGQPPNAQPGQQPQPNGQPVAQQPPNGQPPPQPEPKSPPKPSETGIIEDEEDPKAFQPVEGEDEATSAKRKLYLARRWKQREAIMRQVKSSGLDETKQASIMASVQDALDRMPSKAITELDEGVYEIMFHADEAALGQAIGAEGPVSTCYVRGGEHGGVLHLVAGEESTAVYLHGIGHAVDGSLNASEESDWQSAWQAELTNKSLTNHAAVSAQEGFAEFARYAWSGLPREEIMQRYPQCSAVFEKHKLL